MWTPISQEQINKTIENEKSNLNEENLKFWNSIKIEPQKWKEKESGMEGDTFWVVAIFENIVIWYNDIEDGFNISSYTVYGTIDEYGAEQDELQWTLNKLKTHLKIK